MNTELSAAQIAQLGPIVGELNKGMGEPIY